jgi:hypothetical protein
LYSISHDIDIRFRPLARPQRPASGRSSYFFFIPHSGIVNRSIKKHLEHLQQFQFPHDLDRTIHERLAFQEIPEIFLREDDGLHDLAERYPLACAARANFSVAVLDIEFILTEKPFAEVAINFVDSFPQFMWRNLTKVCDLLACARSSSPAASASACVSIKRTNL